MNANPWTSTGYRNIRFLPSAALLSVLLFLLFSSASRAQKPAHEQSATNVVTVAAAADMQPVFEALGPIFERKTGLKLKVSFASSATLSQQLQNGSPADIFFSADYYFAEQLVAAGLTETRQPTPYARGILVAWTARTSRFKPLSVDDLARKDLKAVAIANPDRAPYGRAAVSALKQMKLYDGIAPHLVQAESVGQAAQFALSGNAEIALISQTIAMSAKYRDQGTFVLIPLSQYPDIRQCAVVLKAGANREGAHRLLAFMLGNDVQPNLPKLGLQPTK